MNGDPKMQRSNRRKDWVNYHNNANTKKKGMLRGQYD